MSLAMLSTAVPVLSEWESFYVIAGSSGGALVGLQFIVLTLIAERRGSASRESLNAFGTPTVVHFAGVLVISAVMSAPWASLHAVATALVLCGVAGLVYGWIVIRRARRQADFTAAREDWIWYIILPSVVYGILAVAALCVAAHPESSAFIVGGSVMALLLIGVRNAWDTVTYVVIGDHSGDPQRTPPSAP